jgi:hypothetical protein
MLLRNPIARRQCRGSFVPIAMLARQHRFVYTADAAALTKKR